MPERALIPRRALFGNPGRSAPRISPDGRHLAWTAPRDGVMNAWVAPVGDLAAAAPLTRSARPVWSVVWAHDGRHLLYLDDTDGDENWRLWAVDREGGDARVLTPRRGVAAKLLALSPDRPGLAVVGLNERDRAWHDAWLVDLATGARSLAFANRDGYGGYSVGNGGDTFDSALSLRLLNKWDDATGGRHVFRCDGGMVEPAFDIPHEDAFHTEVLGFERDGAHYLLTSSVGRDTSALFRVDATTGGRVLLAEHPRSDVLSCLRDPVSGRAVAARFAHVREEWVALDPAVEPDLTLLQVAAGPENCVDVHSQTADGTRWIAFTSGPQQPGSHHLLDRFTGRLDPVFDSRPDLKPYRLAPMHGGVPKARDGLDLVTYVTLPAEVEGERPPAPLPTVLCVHGGPSARDSYGFRPIHQWLANRGYAVMSVNYRGSHGFGKGFLNAADREHAGRMHDDLVDAVDWAVREGIADRDRVAITGGSYGGCATLVGLTFTPEVFRCGASLVGFSSLITMLENMPPCWHAFAVRMHRRFHDPRTAEGRAWLWSRSPLSRVDRVARPLLIGHGQNDVRCTVAEADQIVAAMRERGLPVCYVVYPGEGHFFRRPENDISFHAVTEAFFAEHLGGRCEPAGDDLAGSSLQER